MIIRRVTVEEINTKDASEEDMEHLDGFPLSRIGVAFIMTNIPVRRTHHWEIDMNDWEGDVNGEHSNPDQ